MPCAGVIAHVASSVSEAHGGCLNARVVWTSAVAPGAIVSFVVVLKSPPSASCKRVQRPAQRAIEPLTAVCSSTVAPEIAGLPSVWMGRIFVYRSVALVVGNDGL